MASTIDPTLNGDMTADGRVVNKSELQQQFTAAAADIVAIQGGTVTMGSGIDGVAAVAASGDGLIETKILIDLTGLNSSAAADIIGDDAAANCHIGQYTVAAMGTIVAGTMLCLEAPTTGEPDIDLYSADEATGTEDAAVTGLTNDTALLAAAADWTIGTLKALTAFPADEQYLYLVGSGGGTDATYDAGKFLLTLYGTV